MDKKRHNYYIYLFLFTYLIINVFFLTRFPFVHSDEAWLGGLSRNILNSKDIFTTETFFNLYPRNPHSIKSLFHLIQIAFIMVFGYNILSLRFISLIFSVATLFIFYQLLSRKDKTLFPLLSTILLSLNIQFIYSSHFARQEIIIIFLITLGLYIYLYYSNNGIKYTLLISTLIGFGIGIHPNSFIIALIFGLLYIYDLITGKKPIKYFLILFTTTTLYAIFFIVLSLIGDSNFIFNYKNYGGTLGVDLPFINKIENLKLFYMKIYHNISGTYYIPNMKYFWIVFAIIIFISIIILLIKFKSLHHIKELQLIIISLICITAINIGILIIGRFNTTSIIFLIPFFYILFHNIILIYVNHIYKIKYVLFIFLIFATIVLSSYEIKPYLYYDYNDYLNNFSDYIPKNAKTLGNLNSEFYFENNSLLDYRNLAFLKANNTSFEEYIHENNIEYIIYYEELDYIHNNPKWLILYGQDDYYNDFQQYIENNCSLIHSFTDKLYGIRISRYMMDYDWEVKIYKVK